MLLVSCKVVEGFFGVVLGEDTVGLFGLILFGVDHGWQRLDLVATVGLLVLALLSDQVDFERIGLGFSLKVLLETS